MKKAALLFVSSLFAGALLAHNISLHWSPYPPVISAGGLTIEGTGEFTDTDTTSGSGSHTVQAGTDLLLVFFAGYGYDGLTPPVGAMTYNGVSMSSYNVNTIESGGAGWADDQHTLFYLTSPATGTNTLAWSGGGSIYDGGIFHAINLGGVDTAVGSGGIRNGQSQAQNSRTTITLSPGNNSDDLIVAQWSQQESTATTGQTYGGTSGTQTVRESEGANGDAAFLTTSVPTGASQNVTFLGVAGSKWPSGVAVSIAGE